jgi:hypothetical protein
MAAHNRLVGGSSPLSPTTQSYTFFPSHPRNHKQIWKFDFASNKPITLIEGQNLLALLAKHGYKFKIELV